MHLMFNLFSDLHVFGPKISSQLLEANENSEMMLIPSNSVCAQCLPRCEETMAVLGWYKSPEPVMFKKIFSPSI